MKQRLLTIWACLFVVMTGYGLTLAVLPYFIERMALGAGNHAGTALGIQNAVNSLGQFIGPLSGGILFSLSIHAPYLFTGLLLCASALTARNRKILRVS